MNIKRLLIIATIGIQFRTAALAATPEMPSEISNLSLGMGIAELAKARPEAKSTGNKPIDLEKMATGKFMLLENFKTPGDFYAASYGITDGKVVTIQLMGGAAAGQESATRKRLIKDCVQRWGKKYARRVPEDSSQPGRAKPTLTWEVGDTEISLGLPRTPKKGEGKPNYYELIFRPASAVKTHPWKDKKMSEAEKKALLKAHDLDD